VYFHGSHTAELLVPSKLIMIAARSIVIIGVVVYHRVPFQEIANYDDVIWVGALLQPSLSTLKRMVARDLTWGEASSRQTGYYAPPRCKHYAGSPQDAVQRQGSHQILIDHTRMVQYAQEALQKVYADRGCCACPLRNKILVLLLHNASAAIIDHSDVQQL